MPQFFQINVTSLSPTSSSVIRAGFPLKTVQENVWQCLMCTSKGRSVPSNIKVECSVKLCKDIKLFCDRDLNDIGSFEVWPHCPPFNPFLWPGCSYQVEIHWAAGLFLMGPSQGRSAALWGHSWSCGVQKEGCDRPPALHLQPSGASPMVLLFPKVGTWWFSKERPQPSAYASSQRPPTYMLVLNIPRYEPKLTVRMPWPTATSKSHSSKKYLWPSFNIYIEASILHFPPLVRLPPLK